MFSKLSSMLHNAVEAFAPNMPLQQEFTAHWKAVTHYFVDNKDHKISVDQTKLPMHLDRMLQLLVSEENTTESGISGPAMEYLLHHKILETLYTLARTDCPPGMKQVVLQFFTKLLSRIRQPLVPHVHVHRPVQRMVRLCGEVIAGPTEADEIQFLLTICAQLKADSYLVNFFIENGIQDGGKNVQVSASSSFHLITSLLTLMRSPDARVAVKACEGLMLCASLPEDTAAKGITMTTAFCQQIAAQLCALYNRMPAVMDPADIESVEAKWGLDVLSDHDDHLTFVGKRQIISFLSWLDYCDQLVHIAHPEVATALAKEIREQFLEKVLQPKLVQASEGGAITATAHLTVCIRDVSSWTLLAEIVYFVLGDERTPESPGSSHGHPLRLKLIERCNHLSEEVSITAMRLFETLLCKENDFVSHNLVLRNLLGRTYLDSTSAGPDQSDSSVPSDSVQTQDSCGKSDGGNSETVVRENSDTNKGDNSETNQRDNSETNAEGDSGKSAEDKSESKQEKGTPSPEDPSEVKDEDGSGDQLEVKDETSTENTAKDETSTENTAKDEGSAEAEEAAGGLESKADESPKHQENNPPELSPQSSIEYDMTPPSSPGSHDPESAHRIVSSFLHILPEEAKTSYETGDTGYDTYLKDAHRQLAGMTVQCLSFQWPLEPVREESYISSQFYEGAFLKLLFDKLGSMLDQSYDINLQVTSLVSKLAAVPHPNLHEFLLNPNLPLAPGTRSLPAVLQKLAADIRNRFKGSDDVTRRLINVRRDLMGFSGNLRRRLSTQQIGLEDGNMLAAVIVLEEFCKELAAISFVKSFGV